MHEFLELGHRVLDPGQLLQIFGRFRLAGHLLHGGVDVRGLVAAIVAGKRCGVAAESLEQLRRLRVDSLEVLAHGHVSAPVRVGPVVFDLIAERTVGVLEFVPFGSGLGEIELRGLLVTGARCRRVRAGTGGGVGLRRRGGRERLLVDLGHLLVPLALDVDPGQVVEVVGGVRGLLQVLEIAGIGRAVHGADDGGDLVGVVAAGGAAPERSPAFRRGQGRRTRLAAPRGRGTGRRRGVRLTASTAAARDEVPHPQRGLHQRAESRLHRRGGGALEPCHRRQVRARAVLALVDRAGELEQQPVGGARPRALLHAHEAVHPEIERRGAAKPQPRRHVVAHRRGDEGAARELVAHHPGHDDVVLEVRVHGERPPDVHLHIVGDDHEAMTRMLVEQPADLDCVAPGDDVAVVVGEADLGAVELAGALGAAPGVLEHGLGAQLERMRPFDTLGRGEGPVARRRLGLGRIEHAEQRRPRGEVDAELAVLLGGRVEAELALVGVADGKLVIFVVAENVPDVDRERVAAGRIGIVVPIEADVDEVQVPVVVHCALPPSAWIGAWRVA